jgi:hypothetical protein
MRGRENSELTRALVRERVDSSILSGTPGKSRKIGTFYVANSSFPPFNPERIVKLPKNWGKIWGSVRGAFSRGTPFARYGVRLWR